MALDELGIADAGERRALTTTIATLQALHMQGFNHIWAYYTRNLVRPVTLARSKVDVIIGNPPWLNYNKTASTLRRALEDQSKRLYGIWVGRNYATHQDVAGLFFARCVDLYLKDGGVIGMVMPHSALRAGQYAKWRTGRWVSNYSSVEVNFGWKKPSWNGWIPTHFSLFRPQLYFRIALVVLEDPSPSLARWNVGWEKQERIVSAGCAV